MKTKPPLILLPVLAQWEGSVWSRMKWKSAGAAVLAAVLGSILAYFNLGYGGERAGCDGDGSVRGGERLVVGVLSARHHRAQRDAIRATWWSQLAPAGARGVFVLGDSVCGIAEVCRRDTFSCELWQPEVNVSAAEQWLQFGRAAGRPAPMAAAVTFVVRHPVVVRGVAGLTSAAVTSAQLQTADGGLVAAAEQQGSDRAPLTPHLLPAGFLGRLAAVPPQQQGQQCELWRPPADGPLLVTSLVLSDGRQVQPGLEPICWPLRLIFSIHEPERLAAELAARPNSCLVSSDVTDQLTAEAEQHSDLALVPGVDVYRSLPNKLMGFFSWASSHSSAEYVIKCDDDVILDVPRIVRHLPDHGEAGVWWGRFRYNWPLDRYGKWAEYQYQAEVYPPFACGTASLLSSSVVRWLAESAPHLARFQGEDVSLGLWLAGHRLRRLHDPGWWCGGPDSDVTGSQLYSRGQLTPAQLRQLWRCLSTTGSLRHCHTAP